MITNPLVTIDSMRNPKEDSVSRIKLNMQGMKVLIPVICFLVTHALAMAQGAHFISVNPDNTFLADGKPLPEKLGSIGWSWHPEIGNGGVLQSLPSQEKPPATLMVKASGLEAGTWYEVFGYFWSHGSDEKSADHAKSHATHLGLSLAEIQAFDGVRADEFVEKEPWVITPGYQTGSALGYSSNIDLSGSIEGMEKLKRTEGELRLIRARLGYSRASKDGSLPVFFSVNTGSRNVGSAIIDGIALRPADSNATAGVGSLSKHKLHLAIRAGDPVTIQREIEAGADVNGFDEEKLTPLFYAAACGDAQLVKKLLDIGAKPDLADQSVSPLTAASTFSDTATVKLLLESGAQVTTVPAKDKGKLAIDMDPRLLHPVVAAIRAGSVPVLKQLLAANGELNLPKFEEELKKIGNESQPRRGEMYFVGNAMLRMDWDMAVYLIDSGASTLPSMSSGGSCLTNAIRVGDEASPVLEALLRRGEPVITKADYRSDDALNTAAFHGHAKLVKRFLPLATSVSQYYQDGLLENALSSGNKEIIEMVRSQFPKAVAPRWQPALKNEGASELDESAKRWFLPRTSLPPKASVNQPAGKHTLAVIASPDAAGVGDILAAHASLEDGWKVVEREKIEAALGEDRFSKPWLDGEHRLSELGDRLTADCLIIVSSLSVAKESIYRIEVVEVETGLEIHREHVKGDTFVDKKEVSGFLERAGFALDAAGRNERHQAITLLTFSVQGKVGNASAVSGLLRAAVQHEVDSTPGLISLSRAQSSRLIEEQALVGKNSVWGAAHMIEGVVSAQDGGGIKVTLRLETFKEGVTTKTDAEAVGEATAVAETAVAAWKKLMSASGDQVAVTGDDPDSKDRALNEGRRLMREADWLHSINADSGSYRPLIESALALGVPEKEAILLHLDAHYRNFLFLYPRNSASNGDEPSTALQNLSDVLPYQAPSIAKSDQLAYKLPAAREFLHQTSWYLEFMGSQGLDGGTDVMQVYRNYKSNEIWFAIQALSTIRALIYPGQIPDQIMPEYEIFAAELDALTKRYFSLLQTLPEPDFYRYHLESADFRLYRRNPALVEGLAGMAAKGASLTVLLNVYAFKNLESGEGVRYAEFQWMASRLDLARKMLRGIHENPAPRLRIAQADLECFLADNKNRPQAIRNLIDACAEVRWHTAPTRDQSGTYLLSQVVLNSCTTSQLFDRHQNTSSLPHNASLIPYVLLSSRSAPDQFMRLNTYHKAFHIMNQREAWKGLKDGKNFDNFRASIWAYDPWELSRLKSDMSHVKPVNGPPSKNSRSLQGGPPGTTSTPESKLLHMMIYGGGKAKVIKTDQPAPPKKQQNQKTEPAEFQANMLVDLRIGKSAGTMIWPLVDKVDSNLLWVFYFPSAGDDIRVNQAGGSGAENYGHVYHAPWLLGINCLDGSVVRKINLHTAVGEAYGMDLSNRNCEVWQMGVDQTKDHILTNVGWYDENYSGNKRGSVIINKKTGKAHPIPGNPELLEGKGDITLDLWNRDNGVAAVGEHFFYLDKAGEWNGGAIEGVRSSELAIFQVFPDLTVKPLTVIGRRPELTPFDVPNRAPISITSHNNRLVVIHPSTIAEFDPVANDWSITASLPSEKPTNKHTNTVADAQYWDYLRSIHELKVGGESTGWIAVGWWHPPGVLPFASRTKGKRNAGLTAKIPDDFMNGVYASEETLTKKNDAKAAKRILIKDHPRFKKSNMVVLAQTENDLILGMPTSDNYEWKNPSRNSHHLPFLWRVSKKEILVWLDGEKSNN